ncbi:Meiotic recombination protein SPO11, partial [Cuculus canorus]
SSVVLEAIENVIQDVLKSLAQKKAPVLTVADRSDWKNIDLTKMFHSYVYKIKILRPGFAIFWQSLRKWHSRLEKQICFSIIIKNTIFCLDRDIYYSDTLLFGSQTVVDNIINDISCMLKIPRRSLHILSTTRGFVAGNLSYTEEDGTKVNCTCSAT